MNVRRQWVATVAASPRWSALVSWLELFRPRWQSRQFWAVQILVVFIAIGHAEFEALNLSWGERSAGLELAFIPTAFFFIPTIYAALNFGTIGAIATVAWCVVLSLPNIALFHTDQDWIADIVQLTAVSATTFFVGQRTDREVAARRRAEAAAAALASSEGLRQAGLRAYAASILRAQEAERQRIARDLHDQTVQELVLLCRQLDLAEGALNESSEVAIELGEARRTAEEVVHDLRDFARSLRPPTLDDLGLATAVRGLLGDLAERANLEGRMSIVGDERRMDADVELAVFRIAQEALRNVEHHASASHVSVTLHFAAREIRLDVVDDGSGFITSPTTDLAASGHLGLLGMRERAETLGGRLEIGSCPGQGTRVTAWLNERFELVGTNGHR